MLSLFPPVQFDCRFQAQNPNNSEPRDLGYYDGGRDVAADRVVWLAVRGQGARLIEWRPPPAPVPALREGVKVLFPQWRILLWIAGKIGPCNNFLARGVEPM
ncbi:MAG: hypothetical protein HY735_19240 [Verrucomicrobia bacterium]|nr:hypothetical protein [Verrucomicrobiota bacterium]